MAQKGEGASAPLGTPATCQQGRRNGHILSIVASVGVLGCYRPLKGGGNHHSERCSIPRVNTLYSTSAALLCLHNIFDTA